MVPFYWCAGEHFRAMMEEHIGERDLQNPAVKAVLDRE
jgi:hypothetical protein